MQDKVICKNIYKNTEKDKLKKDFNRKWIEIINRLERNKTAQNQG